jgi:ligand-binding sensor domain-containing protein
MVNYSITVVPCFAQRVPWRVYSVKQGLPQSQVQTILQDQKGYLWIGTADGLARFDGNSFYNLNKKDGLGSNYIDAGLIDSSGIIWISHRTKGISKINSQTFKIEVLNDPPEIAAAKINDMYQDSSGIYWFATAAKGIFKFDGLDWKQVQKTDGLISNCVNAMCEQKNGYIWFATDKGISLFKRSGSEIEPILSASRKDGLPANRISCIISGRDGNIWLGTDKNGICRVRITGLDISEWRFTHFTVNDGLSSNQIRTLYEDEAGRLWIGTKDKGITIFKPSSSVADPGKFSTLRTRNGLSYHDITTIFQDREGSFWIGTNGGGICQYRNRGQPGKLLVWN